MYDFHSVPSNRESGRGLDKGELLRQLDQEGVFRALGIPVGRKRFCSPFRDDSNPDCQVRWSSDNSKLLYRDYAEHDKWMDVFAVAAMVNRWHLPDDFNKVCRWLSDTFIDGVVSSTQFTAPKGPRQTLPPKVWPAFTPHVTPWTKEDSRFWARFGVSPDILRQYEIRAISGYEQESRVSRLINHGYWYKGEDKLYLPGCKPRFVAGPHCQPLQGYHQLPDSGRLLVLTKSLKDVMALRSLGYNAAAPQSESAPIPAQLVLETKERFTHVVLFYDNDDAGLRWGAQRAKEWGADDFIYLPMELGYKDTSDMVAGRGRDYTANIIKKLLLEVVPAWALQQGGTSLRVWKNPAMHNSIKATG